MSSALEILLGLRREVIYGEINLFKSESDCVSQLYVIQEFFKNPRGMTAPKVTEINL